MAKLIKVNIQTGEVLENNLHKLWDDKSCYREKVEEANPSRPAQPVVTSYPYDETLFKQVQAFHKRRNSNNKNAWSESELYRLAVLMGLQKHNYKQASFKMARTSRACQFMFSEMKKAGVFSSS